MKLFILTAFLLTSVVCTADESKNPAALFTYLEELLKDPNQSLNVDTDLVYRDFKLHVSRVDVVLKLPEPTIQETLHVSKLLIEHFKERLPTAEPFEEGSLGADIFNISRFAHEISLSINHTFYIRYFQNAKNQRFSPSYKIAAEKAFKVIQERDKAQLEASRKSAHASRINTLKYHITRFANTAGAENSKAQFMFYDGLIEVELIKHYPIETEGNVIQLPTKGSFDKIATVRVVKADRQSTEGILEATKALFDLPGIHAVYFDDKLKIPTNLDLKSYEILTSGRTGVLLRKAPLVCSALFS